MAELTGWCRENELTPDYVAGMINLLSVLIATVLVETCTFFPTYMLGLLMAALGGLCALDYFASMGELRWTKADKAVALYLIYVCGQTAFITLTTDETAADMAWGLRNILYSIVLYFGVRLVSGSPERVNLCLRFLKYLAVGVLLGYLAITLVPGLRGLWIKGGSTTAVERLEHGFARLFIPGEQVMTFYTAVFVCQVASSLRLRSIIFAMLGVLACTYTFTRSIWISVLFVCAVQWVFVLRAGRRLMAVGAVGLALSIAFVFSQRQLESIRHRFISSGDGLRFGLQGSQSSARRYYETMQAVRAWLEKPILGNGLGVPYRRTAYNIDPRDTSFDNALQHMKGRGQRQEFSMVHNGLVELLLHQGTIGLALFGNIIFQVVRTYFRVKRLAGRPWPAEMRDHWYSLWTFLVMAEVGGSGFSTIEFALFLFVVLGLLESAGAVVEGRLRMHQRMLESPERGHPPLPYARSGAT